MSLGERRQAQTKAQVLKTILWQEEQALRVDELFEYHISCELIAHYFKAKEAKRALANHREDFGTLTRSLFEVTEAFEGLQSPQFEIGYVPVHFPDAFQHMANVLTCDKLLRPKSFNLAFIQSEIADFLRNY